MIQNLEEQLTTSGGHEIKTKLIFESNKENINQT